MTQVATLELALGELRVVVDSLDVSQMDIATNCEPWTVRQLASHAWNNQLLWAGMVTGDDGTGKLILFPTVDAFVHAWDLSAAGEGNAVEFAPESIPTITAVVEATCTDTERLMAAAGRTIPR